MSIKSILFILCSIIVKSQSSYFDPSFATNGVLTQFPPTNSNFIFEAGAITADQKIIIAGNHRSMHPIYVNQQNTNIIRRFNMDGTLDPTFNTYTRPPQLGPISSIHDDLFINNVIIQSDGKILLSALGGLQLIRLNANGFIDITFGTNGTLDIQDILNLQNLYGDSISPSEIYSSNNNKILIFREGGTIPVSTPKIIVLRLNENGTIDTTFGTNGFIIDDGCSAGLLMHSLKPVVYLKNCGYPNIHSIKRYTESGQLDTTFQNGNLSVPTVSGYDTYFDAWATNGGSIYMKGPSLSTIGDVTLMAILKLQPNGFPDNSFGINGLVMERYYPTSVPNYMVNTNHLFQNLLIDPDENLYVATSAGVTTQFDNQYIKKFTSQGVVDSGFGNNGLIEVDLNGNENLRSALLQPDGKILTFGSNGKGIVTRLLNNSTFLKTENPTTEQSRLFIYPNPVSHYINVVHESKDKDIPATIFDLSGRLVMSGVLENSQMDVSSLSAGNYIIRIGEKTAKFIKR